MEDPSAVKRQLNLRLPQEALDVLEAVRFVDGHGSVQQVAAQVLLDYADRRAKEPRVQTAMRLRSEQDAEQSGRLRSLQNQRQKGTKDDP